jgi:dihydroflavonol-4-reductase
VSRYLVTGSTGFLGSHVARALEARGHEVVPFSRSRGGDILDFQAVVSAAQGCRGAFHCAGKVSRKPGDAEALYRLHVDGTKTVLDACAAARVRRVVVASTSGTMAVSEDPAVVAREDDEPIVARAARLASRWPYYRAKIFAERAALERNHPSKGNGAGGDGTSPASPERGRTLDDGFEVLCVNPSLLLGPGDVHGSSSEDVRRVLEGRVPAVPSGGLSFVDARDAAEAMVLAMERGRPGDRYLVGACNLSLRDFFERVARVAGVKAPWLPLPRSRTFASVGARWVESICTRVGVEAPVDAVSVEMAQCFWYLDASKAERELGWKARDPNVTLFDTVEDLRSRGVVWPEGVGRAS